MIDEYDNYLSWQCRHIVSVLGESSFFNFFHLQLILHTNGFILSPPKLCFILFYAGFHPMPYLTTNSTNKLLGSMSESANFLIAPSFITKLCSILIFIEFMTIQAFCNSSWLENLLFFRCVLARTIQALHANSSVLTEGWV